MDSELIRPAKSPWVILVQPVGSPTQEQLVLPSEFSDKAGPEIFNEVLAPALEKGLLFWTQPDDGPTLAIQTGPGTKFILMRKTDLDRHIMMQRMQQMPQVPLRGGKS